MLWKHFKIQKIIKLRYASKIKLNFIDQNEVHNAIQIAKRLQNNFDIIFFITDLLL